MRSFKFAFLLPFLVIFLGGCAPQTISSESDTENVEVEEKSAALVIHLPENTTYSILEVPVEKAVNVRELMLMAKKVDAKFQFTDTLYTTMGHLLTSLQGVPNSKGEGAYWQFCVANTASDRGIDEKMVAPGEKVDWHFVQYGELPCKKIGE